jgi:hypothetical protein
VRATLLQAWVASAVLILLPLAVLRRSVSHSALRKHTIVIYFTVIGLAFMFIEMAFIQRFIIFLHHPLYATAVVLSGFLLFAVLATLLAIHVGFRMVIVSALLLYLLAAVTLPQCGNSRNPRA